MIFGLIPSVQLVRRSSYMINPTIVDRGPPHGVAGFYLGPAIKHHRCFTLWSSATNAVRITDTLAWFLDNLQLPSPSIYDLLLAAIHDLTTAIHTIRRAHSAFHHHRQLSTIPSLVVSLRLWQERGTGRRRAKGEWLWSDSKG